MTLKKGLFAFLCSSILCLSACSSSDSVNSAGDNGGEGGGGGGGNGGTPSDVPLSPSANAAATQGLYDTWKGFHYVNMATESSYYASIAGDFGSVFGAYDGSSVGRVIWSTQNTGYYKQRCVVQGSTDPGMKFRGCTVSEGIGYGMLISYFQGDDAVFNSLWNYTKAERAYYQTKLMPWITYTFHYETIDGSSATDADLDIATSLILMSRRTGNQEYLNDALTFINAIWDTEVNPSTLLLYSGNTSMWTGANPTYNLSYFAPAALRLFAEVDGAHDWNGVINNMYAYMKQVQANGTGVFPDWSDAAGVAANPPNQSAGTSEEDYTWYTFNKESVRIPWRIAWDYYWNKSQDAADVLNKLNAFIVEKSGGDPNSAALGTSYSWNTSLGPDKPANAVAVQWLGAWCLTGIAGNSGWLQACTDAFNAQPMQTSGSSYFPNILQMMFSQLLNGKYIRQ